MFQIPSYNVFWSLSVAIFLTYFIEGLLHAFNFGGSGGGDGGGDCGGAGACAATAEDVAADDNDNDNFLYKINKFCHNS